MKPVTPDSAAVPDATRITSELTTTFESLGTTLASIKDAATADAAAPSLRTSTTNSVACAKCFECCQRRVG